MNTFIKLIKDDSGASAAEYALILAIVGSGIALAAIFLGGAIGQSLRSTGSEIIACTDATAATTTGC